MALALCATVGCRARPPAPSVAPDSPTDPAAPPPAVDAQVDVGAQVDAAPAPAAIALDAAPGPAPAGPPPAGWVDVAVAIPDAVLDLRYATANNLTGAPLYPVARCWLRAAPAAQLVTAADLLRQAGHRLLLWDCYRPASVQQLLWDRVPDPRYVARPRFDDAGRPIAGSVHSRGAAIDVSLADPDGRPRTLPTDHDDFSAAASGRRATGAARANLAALRAAMATAGFAPIASEWWHFEAGGGRRAPLADEPLR